MMGACLIFIGQALYKEETPMAENKNPRDKGLSPVAKAMGTVKPKRTRFQRICDKVTDNVRNSKLEQRVVEEIALPMILDICTTTLAGILGIEARTTRNRVESVISSVRANNYHSASNSGSRYSFVSEEPQQSSPIRRSVYDFELPIVTQTEVEEMYLQIQACMEQHGNVSVADIIQLADTGKIPTTSDYDYGWKTIEGFKMCHVHTDTADGWIINPPKPIPLD